MTSQTHSNRPGWWRAVATAVASGALAAGVLAAAPAALAVPDDSSSDAPAPTMTAEEALAIVAKDYDHGAGGGQLSNLIHEVLTLRNQGFKPSNANKIAIQEALERRPNQAPLVAALSQTVSYQRKIQAQSAAMQDPQTPVVIGRQPLPPGVPADPGDPDNSGIGIGLPGDTINQPIG
jgi:hypothetical protein